MIADACRYNTNESTLDMDVGLNRRLCFATTVCFATTLLLNSHAYAVGIAAGLDIDNNATATYSVGGEVQSPVSSNAVRISVDEILDATVTSNDGAPLAVTSPGADAVLSFTVANTGNGIESFRLIAEDGLGGDDFDPTNVRIYVESNGVPGLQVGVGGDIAYAPGGEPSLAADAVLDVYLLADTPAGFGAGATARLGLRAVAVTLAIGAGTDDPADAGFPQPGAVFAGAGDAGVDAVVGITYQTTTFAIRAEGQLRVSDAVVDIDKSLVSVTDPFGGATVVPGAVLRYAIAVTVVGAGTVDTLLVTDTLPAALEFVGGSLTSTYLPAGQELDDDFTPGGTDNTGFDAPSTTVQFDLGSVAGGGAPITVGFDARIR